MLISTIRSLPERLSKHSANWSNGEAFHMGKRFSRSEILVRLRKTEREGKPIVAAGCSAGIIAKCAELGGADLIMVYSSGRERLKGLQTNIVDNSNKVTLEMFDE